MDDTEDHRSWAPVNPFTMSDVLKKWALDEEISAASPVPVAEIVDQHSVATSSSHPAHQPFSVNLHSNSGSAEPQSKSSARVRQERRAIKAGFLTPDGKPDLAALHRRDRKAQAIKAGLLTPDGKPDLAALQRSYVQSLADKKRLLPPNDKPDLAALKRLSYEKLKLEAFQMGITHKNYRKFLLEESKKRNFPPRFQGMRKQVQELLETAKNLGLPAGKDTKDFVEAQLVNWKMEEAAASSSSAAQAETPVSNPIQGDDFTFDDFGENN